MHAVTDLPALLPYADVVILLVPLTERTRGLLGRAYHLAGARPRRYAAGEDLLNQAVEGY